MSDPGRQHVERVAGSRRARLTQVPGTLADGDVELPETEHPEPEISGPNDERMLRDKPPHY